MASHNAIAAGVDADMTRIFGAAQPRQQPVMPERPSAGALPRRRSRWLLAALSVGALGAVGMAALRPPVTEHVLPGATAPKRIVAPAGPVLAVPVPVTDRIVPAQRERAVRNEDRPAPERAQVAVTVPSERPPLTLDFPAAHAMPATVPVRPRQALLPVEPAVCEAGSAENRCIYGDVIDADRRLRIAYRRAEQEGVPSGELRQVRQQWDRALEISLDSPDETIRRYDRLAQRLDFAPGRRD